MTKDVSDEKPLSISAELTPTKAKVSIFSRMMSAFDNWGASYANRKSISNRLELAKAGVELAKVESQTRLITASTDSVIKQIKADPEKAERVLAYTFNKADRELANIDAVLEKTRASIENEPLPTEIDEAPDSLSKATLDRLEPYFAGASTDELREKWSRVLKAEILAPGTVTPRLIRIVNEVEVETAQLFSEICKSRMGNIIPLCLIEPLGVIESAALVSNDLIIEPGLGKIAFASRTKDAAGLDLWAFTFDDYMIAFSAQFDLNSLPTDSAGGKVALINEPKIGPSIPVHALTAGGQAIAGLAPSDPKPTMLRFIQALKNTLPPGTSIRLMKRTNPTSDYEVEGFF